MSVATLLKGVHQIFCQFQGSPGSITKLGNTDPRTSIDYAEPEWMGLELFSLEIAVLDENLSRDLNSIGPSKSMVLVFINWAEINQTLFFTVFYSIKVYPWISDSQRLRQHC